METTTMYFARVELRKNYWVSSQKYATMQELLANMADYLTQHPGTLVRFFEDRVIVQG
jgi:ribulose bisphosphate carboxylase small subunit